MEESMSDVKSLFRLTTFISPVGGCAMLRFASEPQSGLARRLSRENVQPQGLPHQAQHGPLLHDLHRPTSKVT